MRIRERLAVLVPLMHAYVHEYTEDTQGISGMHVSHNYDFFKGQLLPFVVKFLNSQPHSCHVHELIAGEVSGMLLPE